MTELIDLATLASLGQHFSSRDDVDELKGVLAGVQNDLAVIKNFLLQQFGSEFSKALKHGEHHEQERPPLVKKTTAMLPPKLKAETNRPANGVPSSLKRFLPQEENNSSSSSQQQRPRPPPLQRFSRVTSSDEGATTMIPVSTTINVNTTATKTSVAATTVKSEKFHRNFLSMNRLKVNGGNNQNRFQRSTGSNSSLKSTAMLLNTINGGSIKVETPSGNVGTVSKMRHAMTAAAEEEAYTNGMEDEEFNASEDAYAAVVDGNYEETGEENLGYAAYEETADYQEGDYDDSMTPMVYQGEDGTLYEEYLPMEEGLEITDDNGSLVEMIPNQNSSVRLVNGRRNTTTVKNKTQQRRLSLPATATTGDFDSSSVSGNSGDPNFLKKCKVCHEEVPAYSLFNHVVSTHYKGEVPTCSICKKTFTYKQGLISHMRYHDAEKYDKACSYCGKKFIRRSDVIIHERRLHTGERPFQCPVPDCNQGFVRRYCLLTHVKTNHGEPYMSQIVGTQSISFRAE